MKVGNLEDHSNAASCPLPSYLKPNLTNNIYLPYLLFALIGWLLQVLGFENLVFAIFEFVHALVESSKFRGAVKAGLSDLMYYIVLYMQITGNLATGYIFTTTIILLNLDSSRVLIENQWD